MAPKNPDEKKFFERPSFYCTLLLSKRLSLDNIDLCLYMWFYVISDMFSPHLLVKPNGFQGNLPPSNRQTNMAPQRRPDRLCRKVPCAKAKGPKLDASLRGQDLWNAEAGGRWLLGSTLGSLGSEPRGLLGRKNERLTIAGKIPPLKSIGNTSTPWKCWDLQTLHFSGVNCWVEP